MDFSFNFQLSYSVWLLPKKEDSEFLGDIIEELGKTYGGPKFPPHMTVFGDVVAEPKLITKAVKESITGINQFKTKKLGIEFSDYIFKAAYISFGINSHLQTINERLHNSLSEYNDYVFKPHISLLYKVIDESKREKIMNEVRIKEEVTLDKISLVQITDKVEDWKTISGPFSL